MANWLVKSEPDTYSIGDLEREKFTGWDSVRNYQARNYLRAMQLGERVLFHHSVSEPHGVAGVATVSKLAYPDPTQFDKKSQCFDPKATKDSPRWWCPELKFAQKFTEPISLERLRQEPGLKAMELLKRGSRLSVQPVSDREFEIILALAKKP